MPVTEIQPNADKQNCILNAGDIIMYGIDIVYKIFQDLEWKILVCEVHGGNLTIVASYPPHLISIRRPKWSTDVLHIICT